MTSYLKSMNPTQCYGCRACEHICPQEAIVMKPNEEGFWYPELITEKCVQCNLCTKACPYDNASDARDPIRAVAVQYQNKKALLNSSSGGVFSALADHVLGNNGYVAGCVFDESFTAMHILTDQHEGVERMRGSKYVQSDLNDVYLQIRDRLQQGTLVFFTGTPCQVDGLRGFLKKDYENLLTVDLICHGVPSPGLFRQYLDSLTQKKGTITDIRFRDKRRNGWCSQGSVTHSKKTKTITPFNDSYYNYYYLQNAVSRMSCYSCKYASAQRVGDITIGDYWNIGDILPDVDATAGFSAVLVNTEKGQRFLDQISDTLKVYDTSVDAVIKGNGNLSEPSPMSEKRKTIYARIAEEGYDRVAQQECKFQYVRPFIRKHMPKSIKKFLKRLIR